MIRVDIWLLADSKRVGGKFMYINNVGVLDNYSILYFYSLLCFSTPTEWQYAIFYNKFQKCVVYCYIALAYICAKHIDVTYSMQAYVLHDLWAVI